MALFEIDEKSGLPVWVQLRNRFEYLIKTGHYKPGDQLPSVRSLAAETAINYNTVSKVYVSLENDGYVESVRGRGVFVIERTKQGQKDVESVARIEIEGCIKHCMMLGMTIDEVLLQMMEVGHRMKQAAQDASKRRGSHD